MSNNADPAPTAPGQQEADPMPIPNPVHEVDLDRMRKETDERWANRPRVVRGLDDARLQPREEFICRLPNGGVSDFALAQLEQNRLRREQEERAKAEKQQQQTDGV
ncbi:hypothetical protein ABL78_1860 [Leptomonas seymouri]|uniref:Uncharacterized protein n=1 Tax=Leptomonas seymouri TaxID=5684 RepID=A0A0N0P834_LEPSE|nr:hypothetical protein ABL78_1860 [Leptomonas seymouri]|eukprot:KPI89047.1 hypothetical protein ABL78_1860 [Leptomonas seymouri]